jgi:hypothetical protein
MLCSVSRAEHVATRPLGKAPQVFLRSQIHCMPDHGSRDRHGEPDGSSVVSGSLLDRPRIFRIWIYIEPVFGDQ